MWCEWEDEFEILEYFLFSTIKHRYSALDWCFFTRGEAMVIFLLKLSEFSTQVQYCMTLYPLQPYHKGLFILKSLKEREKKKKSFIFAWKNHERSSYNKHHFCCYAVCPQGGTRVSLMRLGSFCAEVQVELRIYVWVDPCQRTCLAFSQRFTIVHSSWGIHSTFLDRPAGKLCPI